MKKYEQLTKFIDVFSNNAFGEWFIDKEKDGTMTHPIQIPYFNYNNAVYDFIESVYVATEDDRFSQYIEIMKRSDIEWNSESMASADVRNLSDDVILSLLLGAVRSEKMCEGALLDFWKNGSIIKWLRELKKRDTNMCIKLDDLLRIPDSDAKIAKVRFNQHDGYDDPMDLYLSNPEIVNSQWLFWRNKQRFFNVGQIAICLMKLSNDEWLLTTIKRVTKELNVTNGVNYLGEELKEYQQYFGRVIIKYHRTSQSQGMYYNTVCDDLEVLEILPNRFDGDDFPGYDRVRLSYTQLKSIIERKKRSWITALENQKAVYLITDKNNGKLYVGSATSNKGMLLARWSSYVDDGHGENVELKRLVNEQGLDYIKKNFQYSILENYNARIDDKVILERESWWKETLQSRVFGYNDN